MNTQKSTVLPSVWRERFSAFMATALSFYIKASLRVLGVIFEVFGTGKNFSFQESELESEQKSVLRNNVSDIYILPY